ncbi:MAG: acyl-homoserine-lactone synthase [Gallionellales bacterium RIFCSPLOWO2_12_FULL_59_22]|nr:MAG: acyl-homoserine-lactone synthase [Gallionellales bacterium RIFCSPLOWO2_02_FULL_59_110]OGT01555.1 MAG: acyl-homoserine-lactone synthase [Gallionellales bacterium RIFCSPLOWO2_02_58_13]OGT13156.1 MAG: acyl-homoserine-lactone synthase [Gallionellales bacterium RIFCSPLOWO2_12_FULL_59_22]
MSHLIKIASRKEFASKDLWEMHRLRAKVFKGRMGWEVPIMSGMEIDGYDALDPYYMMIREPAKGLRGGMRVLPTEGPYMLKDTFPELLYGHPAPEDPKIWEISRFAIEAEGPHGFGFSGLILDALRELVTFGDKMGIDHYVMVTTSPIERMMRRAGFAITRFGSPMRIGVENAVALDFDIGEQTHEALFGKVLQAA